MASFNVSWKKLTTFCAVMMGCAVLLVNRQNFGPSIRGGVASSLPSLAGGDPNLSCYISFQTVGTDGMSDSGIEAEVKVHVMLNGLYKWQDQKKYYFNIRGSIAQRETKLSNYYHHKLIKNSDTLEVTFEEDDTFSSNDWAQTGRYTNICDSTFLRPHWHAKWKNGGDVYVKSYIETA
mmetsp:Transcript_2395/g.3359  ORF Transcript_2395/g.3359 Transcript_2395/m.3359 type:complete len:178 (+) Transcript_2395:343-876(+)